MRRRRGAALRRRYGRTQRRYSDIPTKPAPPMTHREMVEEDMRLRALAQIEEAERRRRSGFRTFAEEDL